MPAPIQADTPTARRPDPDPDQDRERDALKRHAAGPVGDGREQEAGDRRNHEPEEHLVDVPGDWVEGGRERDGALQDRDPEHHGGECPASGPEEERPESLPEPGGSGERPITRDAGRLCAHVASVL